MAMPFDDYRPSQAEIMAWHGLCAYFVEKLNAQNGFDWRNFKRGADLALDAWNAVLEKDWAAGIELGNSLRRDKDFLKNLAAQKEKRAAKD